MKRTFPAKFLSVMLSLCMLFCMVPMAAMNVSALDAAYDTDGTTILISTAEQLAAIGVDANYPITGAYKLANNIDLSDFDSDSDPDNGNWTPLCGYETSEKPFIYDKTTAFSGSLDGQGYTISGMNIIINGYNTVHVGLFSGVTAGAVIENIVFEDCHIDITTSIQACAGIVAGTVNDGSYATIQNIAVLDCSVKALSSNGSNYSAIGSIAGAGTKLNLYNVYSDAALSGGCTGEGNIQFAVGGMIGYSWRGYAKVDGAVFNGTIDKSAHAASDVNYANGILALNPSVGSFDTNTDNFTNCYYNSDKLTPATDTNGGHIDGTALTSAELESKKLSELGLSGDYWCADAGALALDITLSADVPNFPDYIPIYDAWDMAKIGNDDAYPLDGSYMLMNDIDMSDYGNWTPIAYTTVSSLNSVTDAAFQGVFNGGGHTISNLTVSSSGDRRYLGLFSICYDAQFSDMVFCNANVNASVTAMGYAGVLLGVARVKTSSKPYSTTVTNVAVYDSSVTVENTQIANTTGAGGIVGMSENGVAFYNCYAETDVIASYIGTAGESVQVAAGGFIGMAYDGKITAEDCIFAGTVTANNCTSDYTGEVTAAYKRQNSVMGANSRGISGTSFNTVQQAVAINCYYLDTVEVNPENPRGLDGTAVSAAALKTATADSLGLDSFYWKNDGEGLYLAVVPMALSESGAIEIDTAEKLAAIGVYNSYPRTGSYALTADIDLSSYDNWTPLCGYYKEDAQPYIYDAAYAFTGTFDGQGHTVSNMTVKADSKYIAHAGLFSATGEGAVIKNLAVKNADISISVTRQGYAGALVGKNDGGYSTYSNIAVIDSSINAVTTSNSVDTAVGSIIGHGGRTKLYDIYSNAALSGGCTVAGSRKVAIGGIVGNAWRGYTEIHGAVFDGTIDTSAHVVTEDGGEIIYTSGIYAWNTNQGTYDTVMSNFTNCCYNADKLTVAEIENSGAYYGGAADTFTLGISPASALGLSGEYWMHNGSTPVLDVAGDKSYSTGDVNSDGKQDVKDLIRIKKYIAEMTDDIVLIAADLKRDQIITADDLSYMRKALLGVSNATTIELAEASSQVKYLGRAMAENGILLLDWSNTGFALEGIMEGDVTATLTHSSSSEGYTYARLLVAVDGEESIINVNDGTAVYTLASELDFGAHSIEVVKISERNKGKVYAADVSFMGSIGDRPADSDTVIEFFGDSITAGDGVVKNNRATKEDYTDGQYANLTYAAKTAKALGADLRVAAISGLKTVDAVTKLVEATNWDYTANRAADVVVINLGTNDKSVIFEGTDVATEAGIAAEEAAITAMLDAVRAKYADAKIVWVYGMMGNSLAEYIQPVVEAYAANDANVYYCELPANTSGGGNHPTEAGHATAAEVLADYISANALEAE